MYIDVELVKCVVWVHVNTNSNNTVQCTMYIDVELVKCVVWVHVILILPHLLLTLLITLPVYYTGNIVELREGWPVRREGV